MAPGPTSAWVVLAAWLGLMAGVGAALRPSPVQVLPSTDAAAVAAAWRDVLDDHPAGQPALLLGRSPCGCEGDARPTLVAWARAERLMLIETDALAGIALADADGRVRYAGDPGALAVHCGGWRGFEQWWASPAPSPVVTTACACT